MKPRLLLLICMVVMGCASQDHLREQIKQEYPDCYVNEDLTVECPDPFSDSGAGFGTEVKNKKREKIK